MRESRRVSLVQLRAFMMSGGIHGWYAVTPLFLFTYPQRNDINQEKKLNKMFKIHLPPLFLVTMCDVVTVVLYVWTLTPSR